MRAQCGCLICDTCGLMRINSACSNHNPIKKPPSCACPVSKETVVWIRVSSAKTQIDPVSDHQESIVRYRLVTTNAPFTPEEFQARYQRKLHGLLSETLREFGVTDIRFTDTNADATIRAYRSDEPTVASLLPEQMNAEGVPV